MPISTAHKIIFIHIPRCAGTSLSILFDMCNLENFYTKENELNFKRYVPIENFSNEQYRECISKSPQHYTFKELKNIIPKDYIDTFSKISIVRNPYDRFVSEYNFNTLFNDISFEEYIKMIQNLSKLERIWLFNGHLETQTSFLINEENNFKDINKIYYYEEIENFKKDLVILSKKERFPHYNKSKINRPYQEYYNDFTEKFVYETYKEDFINFKYKRISL